MALPVVIAAVDLGPQTPRVLYHAAGFARLLDLAGHYHFAPRPCAPARANEKAYASYCTPLVGCVADRRARSHRAIPFEA